MKAASKTPRLRRVAVVVNPASGGAGENAAGEAERLLAQSGVKGVVSLPGDEGLEACLRAAFDTKPDLLILVAGDGTARSAAEMAGPRGPLLAPLPGGTMNMLPGALYGSRDWKTAMSDILRDGVERPVSGGEIDGHAFYVAAILGSPALWASAREAVREGDLRGAFWRARRAVQRAFSGSLRFTLRGQPTARTEALMLMCPMVSRALDPDDGWLEATAVDPAGARDVFRLGFRAATGNWRADPAVDVARTRQGKVWAGGRIPAVLDGEPVRLGRTVKFRFRPVAFRALVPRDSEAAA